MAAPAPAAAGAGPPTAVNTTTTTPATAPAPSAGPLTAAVPPWAAALLAFKAHWHRAGRAGLALPLELPNPQVRHGAGRGPASPNYQEATD